MVTYWQDIYSGVVIKFTTDWDAKEMTNNPEYKKVSEKEFKAYSEKEQALK